MSQAIRITCDVVDLIDWITIMVVYAILTAAPWLDIRAVNPIAQTTVLKAILP